MALWKLSENIPITYWTCAEKPCVVGLGGTQSWPGEFCTEGKLYSERLSLNYANAGHLFYYPPLDGFILIYVIDNCWGTYFLGIAIATYHVRALLNPASGVLEEVFPAWGAGFQELFLMAPRGIEVGSYGKVYCTSHLFNTGKIFEFDYRTMGPLSGGWFLNFADLPQFTTYFPLGGFVPPSHSVVNREDGIVALASGGSPYLYFWDIASSPHVYMGKITAPGAIADLCYEDRQRLWLVTRDGYIQKINYQLLRTELLSEVQDRNPTDLNYLIAWDQKRFRLAVFRHKPDATDGACTSTLEFYRPLPKAALLTDPVPIQPLRYGKRIPFSFHLVGTAGEGIAPYLVEAELAAPVEGALPRSSLGTGPYGIGGAEYAAPYASCEETLILQATITDGQES